MRKFIIAVVCLLSLHFCDAQSTSKKTPTPKSEIKTGAKQGWQGIKTAGRAVGHTSKRAAKSVGHGTKKIVKDVKKDVKK